MLCLELTYHASSNDFKYIDWNVVLSFQEVSMLKLHVAPSLVFGFLEESSFGWFKLINERIRTCNLWFKFYFLFWRLVWFESNFWIRSFSWMSGNSMVPICCQGQFFAGCSVQFSTHLCLVRRQQQLYAIHDIEIWDMTEGSWIYILSLHATIIWMWDNMYVSGCGTNSCADGID
jgi:hypothetical protein